MCSGSHRVRSPLSAFAHQLVQKLYGATSPRMLAMTHNNFISPSVTATINGNMYDHESLLAYYESQRAAYTNFAVSFQGTIDYITDEDNDGTNRAGVVGTFMTYTATRADTGKKVFGRASLNMEVVPENEGILPINTDPRMVWKWDMIRSEQEMGA